MLCLDYIQFNIFSNFPCAFYLTHKFRIMCSLISKYLGIFFTLYFWFWFGTLFNYDLKPTFNDFNPFKFIRTFLWSIILEDVPHSRRHWKEGVIILGQSVLQMSDQVVQVFLSLLISCLIFLSAIENGILKYSAIIVLLSTSHFDFVNYGCVDVGAFLLVVCKL